MRSTVEIRIGSPSEVTRKLLSKSQISKDYGDILVLRVSDDDPNFGEVCDRLRELQRSKRPKSEFISFIEFRFQWTKSEIDNCEYFVLRPIRRFYNQVDRELSVYENRSTVDGGHIRIQKSPLILPSLKDDGSPIKYLSNGALVIRSSIKERLIEQEVENISFLPVLRRNSEANASQEILDCCVGKANPVNDESASWFQIIANGVAHVELASLNPLKLFDRPDRSDAVTVLDHSGPLRGDMTFQDGAFTDIRFGGEVAGLWYYFRPLVVSKRLISVFAAIKQSSILIDPFFGSES